MIGAALNALAALNAPNEAPTWAVLIVIPLFLSLGILLGIALDDWHEEIFARRARRRGWLPPAKE